MTVSEYIFDFLEKKSCKVVHMVSGSSAMWLTDALKRNEDLQVVCCQHEQVAAMAADGVGRTGSVPGVCLVTIGPGATNAITGVAGAYLDSSPMFVLSGQSNSKVLTTQKNSGVRQKGTQSLCLESMVSPITKYFAEIMDEAEIRYHMEKAYALATEGRKGPVWIDVPVDIQNKQVPETMEGYTESQKETKEIDVSYVKECLEKAKRPLILAGNGVVSSGETERFRAFVNRLHIPVVLSRNGIGALHSESPFYVGRPGSYGDRASHFAIQQADVLLILGSRLSMSTVGYYPDQFGKKAKKIWVEIDEKEIAREEVPVDCKYNCSVTAFLDAMERTDLPEKEYPDWSSYCQSMKEKYNTVQPEYEKEEGINSYVFTKELSRLAPTSAGIVVDTGSVCNIVSQSWFLKEKQKYVISGGLSCMGFWASALGVAETCDSVVALSGDGSVQMNIQDFATLQYYRLPVKLFVYNNKGYMLIRHNQHNYMNDRFLGVGPDSGVPSVDFCKVAEAYGISHFRIEKKEEIKEVVENVFATKGPVVCEVMVQEFGIIAPRIASKVMPDGSLKAADFDDLWPFLEDEEKHANIME